MNFLAHAYLSFHQPEILVGNMISDFVKGKQQYDYPIEIQKGIQLHRAIDAFTDAHPLTTSTKQYFVPAVGRYAGAFLDVAYDHFLACDILAFHNDQALSDFAIEVYATLNEYVYLLPDNFKKILPNMQQYNWLYNYQFNWGIEKSFKSIAKRASFLENESNSMALFNQHYLAISKSYESFFPALKQFVIDNS